MNAANGIQVVPSSPNNIDPPNHYYLDEPNQSSNCSKPHGRVMCNKQSSERLCRAGGTTWLETLGDSSEGAVGVWILFQAAGAKAGSESFEAVGIPRSWTYMYVRAYICIYIYVYTHRISCIYTFILCFALNLRRYGFSLRQSGLAC